MSTIGDIFTQILLDPIGKWFGYSGVLIFAAGAGILFFNYFSRKLDSMNESLGAVKENVVNHHPKNMREEGDDRHSDVQRSLSSLTQMVDSLDTNVKVLTVLITGHDRDIDNLQDDVKNTQTREQIQQMIKENLNVARQLERGHEAGDDTVER